MNITITHLIVFFSSVGAVASLVLVWALKHTANGCEDDKGFHYDSAAATAPIAEEDHPSVSMKQFLTS